MAKMQGYFVMTQDLEFCLLFGPVWLQCFSRFLSGIGPLWVFELFVVENLLVHCNICLKKESKVIDYLHFLFDLFLYKNNFIKGWRNMFESVNISSLTAFGILFWNSLELQFKVEIATTAKKSSTVAFHYDCIFNPIYHVSVDHQLKLCYYWTQTLWDAKIPPIR